MKDQLDALNFAFDRILGPATPLPTIPHTQRHDPEWIEFNRPGTHFDELAVWAHDEPSLPATRETPAEGGLMIDRVEWRGIDITHALTSQDLEYIANKLRG